MQFPTEPVQRVDDTDRYLVPMSVGVRAIAYIIDSFLFALITVIVLYAIDAVSVLTSTRSLSYTQLVLVGAQCGYFFLWEAAVGWTPGKRVFQMRVVRLDGSRCGVIGSFVRNVIRPVDLFFLGVVGAVSIMAGFKRQRLGDRAAHTQVVREIPLPFVPPPYVPADRPKSRRCPRCGALAESGQSRCAVCNFDLDSAPQAQWPFGMPGFPVPGGRQDSSAPARRPAGRAPKPEEDFLEEEPAEARPETGERPAGAASDREPTGHPRGQAGARPGRESPTRPGAPAQPSLPFGGPALGTGAGRGGGPSDLAADLYGDDADARLYAGREILMDGGEEDVRELARAVGEWDAADRQFIINIGRTLDGWRPVLVLEAMRNDADEEIATGAREALDTVTERNRREEEEQRAWEAARTPREEEDGEEGDEDSGADGGADDDDVAPEAPAAPQAPEAPELPETPEKPHERPGKDA